MTVKLYSISAWKRIEADKLLVLDGGRGRPRKIRLEVNTFWPTRVALMVEGQGPFHLAHVDGYELIEFHWAGEARISFSSAYVGTDKIDVDGWYFTNDGLNSSYMVEDPETFTTLHKRRQRDPEFERMQMIMMRAVDARVAQMLAQEARNNGADPETGEIEDGEADAGSVGSGVVQDVGQADAGAQAVVEAGSPPAEAPKASDPKPAPAGA